MVSCNRLITRSCSSKKANSTRRRPSIGYSARKTPNRSTGERCMKRTPWIAVLTLMVAWTAAAKAEEATAPVLFRSDGKALAHVKEKIAGGDKYLAERYPAGK